jgi:hypothetical protein
MYIRDLSECGLGVLAGVAETGAGQAGLLQTVTVMGFGCRWPGNIGRIDFENLKKSLMFPRPNSFFVSPW